MRFEILTKDQLENEIQFYDLASIQWSNFKFEDGYTPYYLTQTDVDRAWIPAFSFLGDPEFEDIIWLINGIVNPFELAPGQMLKIPNPSEVERFIYNNSQRTLNNR